MGGGGKSCQYLVRKNSPVISSQTSYEHVKEYVSGNGFTNYSFSPSFSFTNNASVLNFGIENVESRKILSKEVYSESQKILSREEHSYETDYTVNEASSDYRPNNPQALTLGMSFSNIGSWIENCFPTLGNVGTPKYLLEYNIYHINGGWVKNKQTINTAYYYDDNDIANGTVTTTIDYLYDNPVHAQVTRMKTTNSNGDILETKTYFPDDVNTLSGLTTTQINTIERLQKNDLHQIGVPIQVESWNEQNGTNAKLSTQRTFFKDLENGIVVPGLVQASKGTNNLEDRLEYTSYDSKGNILEARKSDGSSMSYVWGYDRQYPVAKVENATRAQIEALSGFGADFHTGSGGFSTSRANTLRNGLPNAMITTYTYDPLVGVTSMTDPRGYTIYYEYDNFNRLKEVKDADGNLVSDYEYRYKNQQ